MWILFNKSSTLFSLHCFFSHHLLQPQVLDQRSWFESSVASNWTGTEGTLVMWWQWQEEQCPEPWILESGVWSSPHILWQNRCAPPLPSEPLEAQFNWSNYSHFSEVNLDLLAQFHPYVLYFEASSLLFRRQNIWKLRVENHFSTEKRMEIKSCVKRQKVTVVWCVLFLWLTGHNSDETVHTEGSAQNQLFLVIKIGLRSYCGAWRPHFDPGFASSLPVSVSCHSSWSCTITVGLWFNLNWP